MLHQTDSTLHQEDQLKVHVLISSHKNVSDDNLLRTLRILRDIASAEVTESIDQNDKYNSATHNTLNLSFYSI